MCLSEKYNATANLKEILEATPKPISMKKELH
jgi:hypothetical protein